MKTRIPQLLRHALSARILKKTRTGIEPLESRIAPASLVSLTNGDLLVFDSVGGNDAITISVNGGNYHFNDPSGISSGSGSSQIDGNNVEVPIALVTGNFSVVTNGGNDTVTFASAISVPGDLTAENGIEGLTVNGAITAGGNVTLGSTFDLNVNASIFKSGTAAQTLTIRASNDIIFNSSADVGVSGSGVFNVVLNSDRDAAGGGKIVLNTGTVIDSNGGNITLGGGADPLTMPAVGGGGSTGSNSHGITLIGAQLLSGAGAISLHGQGGSVTTGETNIGVQLNSSSLLQTSTGGITIFGTGGTGSGTIDNHVGVAVESDSDVVSTGSGAITITGIAGAGNSRGISVENAGSTVNSQSTGAINLFGMGGAGSGQGGFSMKTGGAVLAGGGASVLIEVDSVGGADSFALIGTAGTISGTGTLTIRPASNATTIGIGAGATGVLNLDATDLSKLADGFSGITIGRTTGTGAADVNASTFNDNVTILAGSMYVTELNAGTNNVTLTTLSGPIGNGGDVGVDVTGGVVTLLKKGAGKTAGFYGIGDFAPVNPTADDYLSVDATTLSATCQAGSIALRSSGTGGVSMSLSQTNTFGTGNTFVTSLTEDLTITSSASAATASLYASATGHNVSVSNVSIVGASFISLTTTTSGNITVASAASNSGALNLNSAGNIVINGAVTGTANSTWAAGGSITGAGNVTYSGASTLGVTSTTGGVNLTGAVTVAGTATIAAGAANDITLTNAGNALATVNVTSGATVSLLDNSGFNLGTVNVSALLSASSNGAITQSGPITGLAGLTKLGTGTLTLSLANTYTGTTTINGGKISLASSLGIPAFSPVVLANAAAVALNLAGFSTTILSIAGGGATGGGVTLGTGTLTTTGGATTYAGVISGAGGLTVTGGAFGIAGANTYSGATNFLGGTVRIQGANVIPDGVGKGNVTLGGSATLDLNGFSEAINGLTSGGTIVNTSGSASTISIGGNNQSSTFSGAITGAQTSLVKAGIGTLTLATDSSYGGTTTISGGTLQVGAGGVGGSLGSGAVVDNGTLSFNRSDTVTVPNDISGTGALVKLGTGALALAGANTYSGTTTISTGTLQIGIGGTAGTLGSGAVVNSGELAIFHSDSLVLANAISGTGALTQFGTGTTTLTGTNTYAGVTAITGGTLQVGNGGTSGTLGSGAVLNNAALIFSRSDSLTIANDINGPGTLSVTAGGITTSGVLNLSEDTTFNSTAGITFNNSVTMALGKNLTASALGTISLANASADISASGTGTITLTTARDITLTSGASVVTVDGALTLMANMQGSATTGSFSGITVAGAIASTGTGTVFVQGRGGDSASNYGVHINGGTITGGIAGSAVTVQGTGGTGAVSNERGVTLTGASGAITSLGGNVTVIGQGGGGGAGSFSYGVDVRVSSTISAGGSGTVTVTGTGGDGSGAIHLGVHVLTAGQITSSGGAVSITGTGGAGGGAGVDLNGGTITSGGTGLLTILGTGTGGGAASHGVFLTSAAGSTITSGGGNVSITGIASTGAGASDITAQSGATISVSGTLTLNADSISLDTSATPATVSAGANPASIHQRTAGTLIDLGGADAAGTLGLSGAELAQITALTLQIGDASSGAMSLSGAVSYSGNLTLTTGAGLTGAGSLTLAAGKTLDVNAATGVSLTGAVVVPGATHIDAGNGIISLANAANNFGGTVFLATSGITTVTIVSSTSLTLGASNVNRSSFTATGVAGLTVIGDIVFGGDLILHAWDLLGVSPADQQLSIRASLIRAGGGASTATLTAAGDVRFENGGSLTASLSTMDVILNPDRDASGAGGVLVDGGSTITTHGGNVTIGGGLNPFTLPTGGLVLGLLAGGSAQDYGVAIRALASIQADAGNISILGHGHDGAASFAVGIEIQGDVTTTTGSITLIGTGGNNAVQADSGVQVSNGLVESTAGGSISLTGTGAGTGQGNRGINIVGGTLHTTGVGTIAFTGTGSATGASTTNYGVDIQSSSNVSIGGSGAITINATAGAGSSAFHTLTGTNRIGYDGTNPYSGAILITADSMAIANANIQTTGVVTLIQQNAGTVIHLGGADSAGVLGLTDTELDFIHASNLKIGNGSDTITISAVISHTGDLTLPSILTNFTAGGGLSFALSGTGAAPVFSRVIVDGDIDFTGGTLALTGSLSSTPSAPITLMSYLTDVGTPLGILTGLAEGATIAFGGALYPVSYLPGASGRSILQLLTPTTPTGERVITITDVDDDIITITTTNGKITPDMFTFGPDGIAKVDLHVGNVFKNGASITFAVTQVPGGDGIINIGEIDASGMTLGAVRVTGNLGKIDIGTNNPAVPALRSLTVGSLGTLDGLPPLLTDAAAIAAVTSTIVGSVTRFTVTGDVSYANINVSNKIRYFTVGGDFKGTGSLDMEQQHALAALGLGVIAPLSGGITLANSGVKAGSLGIVKINGNVTNAAIKATGNITAVKVAGNVNKSAIISGGSVKNINIGGDVISDDPNLPSVISAFVNTRTSSSRAVSTLTVNGNVTNTEILIGYDENFVGINSDVTIGTVNIKGTWTASSLAVGVTDFTHDGFGRNDKSIFAGIDGLGTDPTPAIVSRIGSLTIARLAVGTDPELKPNDHFGIIAESIGAATINGVKLKLTAAKDNFLIGTYGDFRLIEI